MTRAGKLGLAVLALGGTLVLVPVILLALWIAGVADFSQHVRSVVLTRLDTAFRREVTVAGAFFVSPSLAPSIVAEDVRIANAEWGRQPSMLQAERVEIEFQLLPLLLDREVVIDRLELTGATVLVERNEDGLNWAPALDRGIDAPGPVGVGAPAWLAEAVMQDSRLIWHDVPTGRREEIRIERLQWTASNAAAPLEVSGDGTWRDRRFHLGGRVGSLTELTSPTTEWPVDLEASLGGVVARLAGAIGVGASPTRLELSLKGDKFAELGDLASRSLPLGAYRLDAHLTSELRASLAAPRLRVEIGEAEWGVLVAEGSVGPFAEGAPVSLRLTGRSQSLEKLGARLGIALPPIGAATVAGSVEGPLASPSLIEINGSLGSRDTLLVRVHDGTVDDLRQMKGISLPFSAEAESTQTLGDLVGIELPPAGSLIAEGVLVGSVGKEPNFALRPLKMSVRDADATLSASGTVIDLFGSAQLDLHVRAEGSALAALGRKLGMKLPALGRYQAETHLTGPARDVLSLENLKARLGNSTLEGQLTLNFRDTEPPIVRGTLAAERLDLGPLLDKGNSVVPEAAPREPALPVAALRAFEAEVALAAERIVVGDRTTGSARARLSLDEGRLTLHDLELNALGGTIAGGATIAAMPPRDPDAPTVARINLRIEAEELDVSALIGGGMTPPLADVEIDIDLAVESRGRSFDQLLSELEGDATIVADEGSIRDGRLKRLVQDVDLLRLLPAFWRRSEPDVVRLNCLVGDFTVEDGSAVMRALLDTRRMTVLGKGTIDLPKGTLDLSFDPDPKSQKLSAAGVPIDVTGTLSDPHVSPRAGETVGRLAGGLIGGLLVPLNQIAGLIGEEARDACVDALRQARAKQS